EVASAPTTQRPEQVRLMSRVTVEHATVCCNNLRCEQIVAGQAELAVEHANTSAHRQAGDAHCRARPGGEYHAVLRERRVDIDQSRPRSHRSNPGARVHYHLTHAGDIYHQAGGRRVSGIRVTTATWRK